MKNISIDGRFWAVFILLLTLLGLGLVQVDAQEPNQPQVPPDAEVGLAIFADRCANCHGITGGGDGELAAQLPVPPRTLTDPEFARTAVPATLFNHITDGIIDAGMPPFGPTSSDPISEENRWNLIALVTSFGAPETSIEMGQAVYEANCLACHGETGRGDGPEASDNANLDLTRLDYWFNRSNEIVIADVPGDIAEHDFDFSDAEQTAVVNYARTFSYSYINPLAPLAPIEGAIVSGQVTNGVTGESVSGGVARLRAFDTGFQEMLNITTTVGMDGRFQFDLPSVQPDWVFLAGARYKELGFSSDAARFDPGSSTLEMPIAVYESTTDPAAIVFEQVHMVLGFEEGVVQVSELYVIANRETAVFIGESGNSDLGTIQFNLPDGVEDPIFERTLGSMDSTIPATEIIPTDTGWADTLPLYPGGSSLNLIVSYVLPYEDGMTLSHNLAYAADSVNIIMPDVGVTIKGGDWEFQGAREMSSGGSSFLSYSHTGFPSGDELAIQFDGEPDLNAVVSSIGSTAVAPRNKTNELLIGGGILIIVIVAGIFLFQNWQSQPVDAYEIDEYEDDEEPDEATRLLQTIADLDDAHERGDIGDDDYAVQRKQLKETLKKAWM